MINERDAEDWVPWAGWRWLPGMVLESGFVVTEDAGRDCDTLTVADPGLECSLPTSKACPDVTHPATRGCLLQLVREWHGDDGIHLAVDRGRGARAWKVLDGEGLPLKGLYITRRSEARALLAAALEADR